MKGARLDYLTYSVLLDGHMVCTTVGEIQLECVRTAINGEVCTALCQIVHTATPVDTPVMVSTELVLT